jgi:adenylate cyclase
VKKAYWKRFGRVPDFRVGVHVGPVVISQIGEEKLFLGLYGDTVNTAARLEQMNKELGTKILVSEPVIVNAGQTWKTILKPLGEKEIRGRKGHVRVYTILSEV